MTMEQQHDPQMMLKGRERAMKDPRYGDTRWSPAGFVFMVTEKDAQEQLRTLLFGWPANAWSVVQKIIIGTPVFLYDIHLQVFHGIFTAITPGTFNLDPLAFGGSHHTGSRFPSQVRCEYHFKYSPTPRWLFQKVPDLFYDGTLKINRLLKVDQVQKMYDIFNTNHFKIIRNLAAVNPYAVPDPGLPLPEAGVHPHTGPPLPWDAPPSGPKPFGVLHETYSDVRPKRFSAVPHHRVDRVQTEYNTKPRKLHDRADDGSNTTVMLANIPIGLIADDCVDSLDQAGFFASYDYFVFRPTFEAPKTTRFGSLIVNMTSRKAAEAVFDEVDRITARWPPFQYPYPQVPVRWAIRQGLEELEATHGRYGFRLSGLPSGWAIPDEQHIFFELPADPYRTLERQQAQMSGRAQPDEQAWESAYQNGLEEGLDEEEGMLVAVSAEQKAFNPMAHELSISLTDHMLLPHPHRAGMNPMLPDRDLPLPPPPPLSSRGISLKRPANDYESREAGKRQKHKPEEGHKTSVPLAFRDTPRRPSPVDDSAPRQTADQLRRADIERRLNSALGSQKTAKAEKFRAPEKHAVRERQRIAPPESGNRHSPDLRQQPPEGRTSDAKPRAVELKQDSPAQRHHSNAARKHPPIPKPKRIVTSAEDSPGGRAPEQARISSTNKSLSPPRSEKLLTAKVQAELPQGRQSDQSSGSLEEGEASEASPGLGEVLAEVAAPAEPPGSQAEGTASTLRAASAEIRTQDEAIVDQPPPDAASSHAPAVEDMETSEPQITSVTLAELGEDELDGREPVSPATEGTEEREPPVKGVSQVVDADAIAIQRGSPEAEDIPEKSESVSDGIANFEFGADFIPLF